MNNTRILFCLAGCLLFLAAGVMGQNAAGSSDKFAPVTMKNVRLAVIPFFNGGLAVGEASNLIEEIDNSMGSKLLWGGGVSLIYLPKPQYSIGVNVERYYKPLPDRFNTISGWIVSGSFALYSGKHSKAIPYIRGDFGFITGKYPDYGDDDLEFGTHTYFRIGAGIYSHVSSGLNVRFEFFYARASTADYELGLPERETIGFTAERVGLEIGVGFPLLSE